MNRRVLALVVGLAVATALGAVSIVDWPTNGGAQGARSSAAPREPQVAPNNAAPSERTKITQQQGEPATLGSVTVSFEDVPPSPQEDEIRHLVLVVTVTNASGRVQPVSPRQFFLVTADGFTVGSRPPRRDDPLRPAMLQPGQMAAGTIAFDIHNTQPRSLIYRGTDGDGQSVEVEWDLSGQDR